MTAMNDDRGTGDLPDGASDGLPDELRRRLADAVSEIRPAPDALDRLREAVPARRRRRRATALTAVATVAVLGIATPMVRTVVINDKTTQQSGSNSESADAADTAPAGDSDEDPRNNFSDSRGAIGALNGGAVNGGPKSTATIAPSAAPSAAAPSAGSTPPPDETADPGRLPPTVEPTTATGTVGPTASPSASPAPACTISDLVQVSNELGRPGSDGVTYGVLEVRNIANRDCTIVGSGHVMVASPPGNPPIQVSVKVHEAGDPASRLPEVAAATGPLTLRPGASYEFQFAWQPTAGTGVNGSCTPGDNPPGPPPPEPALAYALADGDVTLAEVRLSAACGGVVYRTKVYATGTYPRVG
ncbi:hypothetical protein LO772_19010 [Yinghuangia sp. ASG 101]|uniref:hypothetical protein n=1 Tax=Yinghuangia sp. ASG 101 TaxID=2896848 RepID=UPI001E5F292A|nr:hypothetical protein [Yinghuangia sp. ASG 101]UGQ09059.1 hypothetical protein LO772_19010 [Yinghuangia sp. ASG 101]